MLLLLRHYPKFIMKKKKNSFKENFVTLIYAVLAALLIRSFLFEPFSIPSGSMYPTLKVGDYLFVSKFDYGFYKHSFPLSIPVIPKRIFYNEPKRGDVVVFKTPEDNRTDYVKRVLGVPGDKIKIVSSNVFINDEKLTKVKIKEEPYKYFDVIRYREILPEGKSYEVYEMKSKNNFFQTNDFKEVVVPKDSFFVLGDNRDNSQDSRFLGFIPKNNLVGKARVVFISFDTDIGSWLKFWTWYSAFRKDRFLFSLIPDDAKEVFE